MVMASSVRTVVVTFALLLLLLISIISPVASFMIFPSVGTKSISTVIIGRIHLSNSKIALRTHAVTAAATSSFLTVSPVRRVTTTSAAAVPTRLAIVKKNLTTYSSPTRLFMSSTTDSQAAGGGAGKGEAPKAGVATVEELQEFLDKSGRANVVVVDVRNPDATVEPGDQKSLAVASLPGDNNRPQAIHLIWDRTTSSMPLPPSSVVSKDTPIITHCGGGGRGQLAKEYLQKQGYTNVINGAGPKEQQLWKLYGDL
jgi:rhodanese-related sulfurtransferase